MYEKLMKFLYRKRAWVCFWTFAVVLLYVAVGQANSNGIRAVYTDDPDDKPHLHGAYEYLWMPPYDPQPAPLDLSLNGRVESLYGAKAQDTGFLRRTMIKERLDDEVENWLQVFKSFNEMIDVEPGVEEFSSEGYYHQHCIADPDFFRMYADPMCTYLWMRRILSSPIVWAEDIVPVIPDSELEAHPGFKKSANGGVRLRHANGDKSYWKPCHGNGASTETYFSEIVYFFIDRFLGLYRTPPAVLRFLPAEQLTALATDTNNPYHEDDWPWMVDSINSHCGDDSGTEGAQVGWTPNPIEELEHDIKTDHIYRAGDDMEIFVKMMNVTADTNHVDLVKALDTIAFYVHETMCGYTGKWGHNIFISYKADHQQFGPISNIDNDRCQWKKATSVLGKSDIDNGFEGLGQTCRFPENVALRILHLAPSYEEPHKRTLGDLVMQSTRVYMEPKYGDLLSDEEKDAIDDNVLYFAQLIQECIAAHGEDYVFVQEPWYQTYNTFNLNVPVKGI